MSRPCRVYPLGSNTELTATESGKLYIGSVTETGSGASANIGKITTITSTPGAGVYDDVFAAGDYLIIRHQQYGMLGVGQWIKVESVSSTGASTELTLEDGAAEFYKHLNSSGASYTGQTSVGITFEKVMGWGVREMTVDQIDDSIVVPIMERWGSYTCSTAGNDFWRGNLRPLSGTSNTAGFDLAGTVGERIRDPDVVGDHPVANNITTTNQSLEWNSGANPYNGTSFNEGHVDDTDSVKDFVRLKDNINPTIQAMTDAELEVGEANIILEDESGYILIDSTNGSADAGDNILLDTEHSVIERCLEYYLSAANTVGSYFIGTAAGDSDTSSWTSQAFYTDTVIPSSTAANTAYLLYRKESGITQGWSGTRALTNANTAARAANCVTYWTGTASNYLLTDGYPRAATDEVTYKPLYLDSPNLKEVPYTAGASATLAGDANDAGLHLHFFKRLLRTDKTPSHVGTYDLVSGNTAPGTGTWQFCGNCYDRVTTLLDTIYSQGYEGIYSAAYEGIYSAAYVGIYSQGFTAGYTLTYGSGDESPNPQASSEGPTYSGTYSSGFEGIYSSNYVGIYSSNYVGIYSNQYTGSTVITTLETDTYSLWKRIG